MLYVWDDADLEKGHANLFRSIMVRSCVLGLIQCWLHVPHFDVGVNGLDGIVAHICLLCFVVPCLLQVVCFLT